VPAIRANKHDGIVKVQYFVLRFIDALPSSAHPMTWYYDLGQSGSKSGSGLKYNKKTLRVKVEALEKIEHALRCVACQENTKRSKR